MAFEQIIKDGKGSGRAAAVSQVQALSVEETRLYQKNVDVITAQRTITGYSLIGTKESDKKWQLIEDVTSGTITRTRLADTGSFTFSWDDRLTQFAETFTNAFSTLFAASDYALVGDVAEYEIENTDAFSISAWVKPATGTAQRVITSKQAGTGNAAGWRLSVQTQLRWHLSGGASGDRMEVRSTNNINDDAWHHVVMTKAGGSAAASTIALYVDNVDVTGSPNADTLVSSSLNNDAMQISGRNLTSTAFIGNLDEISYWNVELSPTEVNQIYNTAKPGNLEDLSFFGSTVGWYRMGDGVSFPTLPDETTNNDATYTNMVASQIEEEVP